jgi:Outer membrane protein beta-barrel family
MEAKLFGLAPWVLFLDPKTFQTGNPALQPAITDAVNASYSYKNKILSLGYSYTAGPISLQPKVDEATNKLVSALTNAISNKNFNISLTLPFTIAKWWNTQNNISGYRSQSKTFYKATVKTENTSYYVNSTQTFTLPKEFSLQLSGYYYAGGSWGLYYFDPMGSIDLGVQKKFATKRSSLSFNIRGLVKTLSSKSYAFIPEQNLIAKNRSIYGYTNYSLSFNHSFGSDKVKGKRDRSTGAEDEKGRAY